MPTPLALNERSRPQRDLSGKPPDQQKAKKAKRETAWNECGVPPLPRPPKTLREGYEPNDFSRVGVMTFVSPLMPNAAHLAGRNPDPGLYRIDAKPTPEPLPPSKPEADTSRNGSCRARWKTGGARNRRKPPRFKRRRAVSDLAERRHGDRHCPWRNPASRGQFKLAEHPGPCCRLYCGYPLVDRPGGIAGLSSRRLDLIAVLRRQAI